MASSKHSTQDLLFPGPPHALIPSDSAPGRPKGRGQSVAEKLYIINKATGIR